MSGFSWHPIVKLCKLARNSNTVSLCGLMSRDLQSSSGVNKKNNKPCGKQFNSHSEQSDLGPDRLYKRYLFFSSCVKFIDILSYRLNYQYLLCWKPVNLFLAYVHFSNFQFYCPSRMFYSFSWGKWANWRTYGETHNLPQATAYLTFGSNKPTAVKNLAVKATSHNHFQWVPWFYLRGNTS